MTAVLLITIMVCLTTFSQYLIKSALNDRQRFKLVLGVLFMAGAPLLYIKAISLKGLTSVYGLNGLSYLLVFLVSVFLLKEKAGKYHMAGILLISLGVILWNLA